MLTAIVLAACLQVTPVDLFGTTDASVDLFGSTPKETFHYENPRFDLSDPNFIVVESDCEPCFPELVRETDKLVGVGFNVYHQRPSDGRTLGPGAADVRYRDASGRWYRVAFVSARDWLDLFYAGRKPSGTSSSPAPSESRPERNEGSHSSGTVGRIYYPNRGSLWTHPGSIKQHLLSGEHAGLFAAWWVNGLSSAAANAVHSDAHEGRVKWQYVNKYVESTTGAAASRTAPAVAARPPVKYTQSYCPTCPGYVRRRG